MNNSTLRAGTGRRCINPPPGIAHAGWGAQKHEQAEGIDMDLWTTALALSDGRQTALILDIDIQILTNQRADQIRTEVSRVTGLPLKAIRASATHTHSGPAPYKSWIEKGYDLVEPWFADLARWSAEAAADALAGLQPVQLRVARGPCGINANRRCLTPSGDRFLGIDPSGPCDREVLVLRLDSERAEPVVTVVNYACHATIMGPLNRLITPDYPGAMKRVVEQAVGGRCLFLQGAAGDQGPVQGFQGDPRVYRELGAVLGHQVAALALSLRSIPSATALREIVPSGAPLGMYDSQFATRTAVPVQVETEEISVPLREGLPEPKVAADRLAQWKARLQRAREERDEAAVTEATYLARRADLQLRMAEDFVGQTSTGVRANFITFGDVALVGCSIEPFCQTGMDIKARSPFPVTLVSGYTNGRLAYMATAEEWPKGGYEVENSPFGQHAADVLTGAILRRLQALKA
jgi:Neutral/alkaline non-lysosomal ceramidase, N-terminal